MFYAVDSKVKLEFLLIYCHAFFIPLLKFHSFHSQYFFNNGIEKNACDDFCGQFVERIPSVKEFTSFYTEPVESSSSSSGMLPLTGSVA